MAIPGKVMFICVGVLLLGGLARSAQALAARVVRDDLRGTQWELNSYGPQGSEISTMEGTRLVMVFADGQQVGGTDGCNTFDGAYETRFGELLFRDLRRGRSVCTDADLLAQEREYLQALRASGRYELREDLLIIWYGEGQNLIFTRSQPPGLVGARLGRG